MVSPEDLEMSLVYVLDWDGLRAIMYETQESIGLVLMMNLAYLTCNIL